MTTAHNTASGRGKARTPQPAGASSRQPDLSRFPDRWIKSPVRGYCPHTGLSRPAFYNLFKAGKIKSACIKKPGAIRGNRLFHLGSILAYIDSVAEATAAREVKI